MKYFFLLFFLPIALAAQHRTVGKTIFYDKPNGQAVFYLVDDVAVELRDRESNWERFSITTSYFLKTEFKKNFLLKNSKILNNKYKEIGRILQDNFILNKGIEHSDTMEIYIAGFVKKGTVKELSYEELLKKETIPFATQNENNFIVFGDTVSENDIHYKSRETSYKIIDNYDSIDNKFKFMLLKKSIYTDSYLGWGVQDTKHDIAVTVYPNILKKDSLIFSREDVHNVELIEDFKDFKYWEVKTYGCCLNPTKIELVKFPTNETLFTCDNEYYNISFAGINDFILLGFKEKWGEGNNENLVGELGYTINGEKNGKVTFRTMRREYAKKIRGEDTRIDFIQIDSTDRILGWENSCNSICYDWYNEDYNYSYYSKDKTDLKENKFKSVYEATGIGLEFTFKAYIKNKEVTRKAKIIFNKGEVKDKEIYIDFD